MVESIGTFFRARLGTAPKATMHHCEYRRQSGVVCLMRGARTRRNLSSSCSAHHENYARLAVTETIRDWRRHAHWCVVVQEEVPFSSAPIEMGEAPPRFSQ